MEGAGNALDLIEPLISGLVEDPLWSTFLQRLQAASGADYVSLMFRPLPFGPERNRVIHLYSGQPSPPLVSQLYRDRLHSSDPLPYRNMTDGKVYTLAGLLHFDDPEHEAYRRQVLAPSGMNVLRMMRVAEPGGISAWLTLSRSEGEFEIWVDGMLAALAPFLRAALRSYVAIERERLTASVANEAIRRMNFGWLTLDADGRVLDVHGDETSLAERTGLLLRGRGGRLTSADPEAAREIAAAVSASVKERQPRPRAIVLSRDPWVDMLLVASNIGTTATGPGPAFVAYIHADNWSSADRCDQLCQLFNLSPSEARLSLALSRGMSIAEAAGKLGLTVESARTYSKRIYSKTGTRGQTGLVSLIHRSVLPFA